MTMRVPIVLSAILIASASGADDLETRFRELPMEARRLTGPLFWLHGDESKERLEMCLGKVVESGNGCFTAESRPHKDWLGEGWYRDLDICLQKAKKLNLEMSEPAPEAAAHVTVNGKYAGGFIGRPCRVDVTDLLKPGMNEFNILPFASATVRLAIYE